MVRRGWTSGRSVLEVGQCPGNEGGANGTRLPEVTDDLICKSSFGGSGASSHVDIIRRLSPARWAGSWSGLIDVEKDSPDTVWRIRGWGWEMAKPEALPGSEGASR